MFYIFNDKNICVASCSIEPDKEDLETRSEFYIEYEDLIKLGSTYNEGTIIFPEDNKVIDYELEARVFRNSLRDKIDNYLKPASTVNDELVTEEQKNTLINDSLLLARWPSTEGWPYIQLPEISTLANSLLGNPVWSFS